MSEDNPGCDKTLSPYNLHCQKCKTSLSEGCAVRNIPERCLNFRTFPYLKIGETMHLECYIEHVIDSYFNTKILEIEKD